MSGEATSVSPSSIDSHRLHDKPNPAANHMSTTPADTSLLSPYSHSHPYSTSPSPSSCNAEPPSEISDFSEYTDFNGVDDYWAFDAIGQDIDVSPAILRDIPVPSTEVHVEAYLMQTDTYSADTAIPLDTPYSFIPTKSTSPSIPVMKSIPQGLRTYTSMAQYDSSSGPSSSTSQPTISLNIPNNGATLQPNQDMTGNGHMSADGMGPGSAMNLSTSPRVTLTTWENSEEHEISEEPAYDSMRGGNVSLTDNGLNFEFDEDHTPRVVNTGPHHLNSAQNNDWDIDEQESRTGVAPERRSSLSNIELLSLRDREERELAEAKRHEVEEWASHAGESSDADDEAPCQSTSNLATPYFGNRRRAKSTGDAASPQSFPGKRYGIIEFSATPTQSKDPEEGKGIEPVSDTESVRENRFIEGQLYVDPESTEVKPEDFEIFSRSRLWHDSPSYPFTTKPTAEGMTAIEAIEMYKKQSDSISFISRTATWGTRRRSEADVESIKGVGLLKRMSFGKSKDRKPRIFESFGQQFKNNLVRKTSDASNKLKRTRSDKEERGRPEPTLGVRNQNQASLAPPRSRSANKMRPTSPRVNTNVSLSPNSVPTHHRRESFTATSPKNGLGGFMKKAIRHVRSGSDLRDEHLVDIWRAMGGPPVATLPSQRLESEDIKLQEDNRHNEHSDLTGDEEDDDDAADDGDERMTFDPTTPITPTFAGFQNHVLKVNPKMEASYLVDRIAHQQGVRYKGLLQCRVKHSRALMESNCPAGVHCVAGGGSATHFDPKSKGRSEALQVVADLSDGDSNPEGQLSSESFPPGVPMPPTTTLPAEFECQLCFKVKKFQKPSDWTKHVHEDVQPFTCTYQNCREPKSFKRKADWVRHENERHRHLEWWTCEVDDCTHKCYRKDNFLQHLVREHKMQEPKQKTKAAVKVAKGADEKVWNMVRDCHHETNNRPQDEPCKFCGKACTTWKKLTVHLAKHMEHISLPILTLVEQQQVDANTIISPVEALPIRQSPLTPIGMGRQASGSSMHYSNSISPNVQSLSQFSSPLYASPNVAAMPQFDAIYNPLAYGPAVSQPMESHNHFHMSQHVDQDLLYDDGNPMQQNYNFDHSGPQSRIYTPMDQSPLLDQSSRTFTTVNQHNNHNHSYPGTLSTQGYNLYPASTPTSTHTLSPDPPNLSYQPNQNPNNQPAFHHAQSLTPEPASYAQMSPSHPQTMNSLSYPPPNINMLGVTEHWGMNGGGDPSAPMDYTPAQVVGRNRGNSLGNPASSAPPFSTSPQRPHAFSTSPRGAQGNGFAHNMGRGAGNGFGYHG